MDLQQFIQQFAEQFDDTDVETFSAETKFKELDEWSSLIALSVIAMIDDEYDVQIKGDDVRNADTVGQLFEIVKNRK
ncbi:MAG: acyl carrier protein [Odoribacter splanchnicus]|jgi:Phosphopantetheine attachment site.|nr:acyl carrier protein [Odoribacter splanchnicus]